MLWDEDRDRIILRYKYMIASAYFSPGYNRLLHSLTVTLELAEPSVSVVVVFYDAILDMRHREE